MAYSTHGSGDFMSTGEFGLLLAAQKEEIVTTPWVQLPTDTIFKITKIERRTSKFGPCWLTEGISRDSRVYHFFSPKGLVYFVKKHNSENRSFFMISLGQEWNRHTSTRKNNFEILYRVEPNSPILVTDIEDCYPTQPQE